MTDQERRRHPRVPVQLDVSYDNDVLWTHAGVHDLSVSGAHIATDTPLPVGTRISLTFSAEDARLGLDAEVMRVNEEDPDDPQSIPGMGVEFSNVSYNDTELLQLFMERYEAERAAPDEAAPLHEPTAEPEAEAEAAPAPEEALEVTNPLAAEASAPVHEPIAEPAPTYEPEPEAAAFETPPEPLPVAGPVSGDFETVRREPPSEIGETIRMEPPSEAFAEEAPAAPAAPAAELETTVLVSPEEPADEDQIETAIFSPEMMAARPGAQVGSTGDAPRTVKMAVFDPSQFVRPPEPPVDEVGETTSFVSTQEMPVVSDPEESTDGSGDKKGRRKKKR